MWQWKARKPLEFEVTCVRRSSRSSRSSPSNIVARSKVNGWSPTSHVISSRNGFHLVSHHLAYDNGSPAWHSHVVAVRTSTSIPVVANNGFVSKRLLRINYVHPFDVRSSLNIAQNFIQTIVKLRCGRLVEYARRKCAWLAELL